jgi:V/A-type H+-transporting ATPase subunit E
LTGESLDRLISKIQEDAREQASLIVNEAKVSSEKVLEEKRREVQEKAQKACQEILRSAKAEAENIIHRESVDAVIKSRWIILSEKQKILDTVFKKVQERLQSFTNGESYRSMLERLIEDAAAAAGGGKLELLLNKKDTQLRLPLKEMSKKISSSLGVESTLDVSEEMISAIGGVIVQSADKKTKIDNTLGSILERERRSLEPKIAAILFSSKAE